MAITIINSNGVPEDYLEEPTGLSKRTVKAPKQDTQAHAEEIASEPTEAPSQPTQGE